jgi:hypothetical protein
LIPQISFHIVDMVQQPLIHPFGKKTKLVI